jgi:hypothetical protein
MDRTTLKRMICRDIIEVIEGRKTVETNYGDYVSDLYPNNKDVWLLNDTLKKVFAMQRTVTDVAAQDIIKSMARNIVATVGCMQWTITSITTETVTKEQMDEELTAINPLDSDLSKKLEISSDRLDRFFR